MQLAPVLVSVYTRKKHFVDCIESLSRCRMANQTHLFIASDAAKTEADEEAVKEIRNYCAEIKGFGKVELISNEKNLGETESCHKAITRIFSEYDRFIFTEDDNVFSPNFLEFINNGLEYYKDNAKVFSICGYIFPFKIPKKYDRDVFSSINAFFWGTGFWRDKYLAVDFYPKKFDHSLIHKRKISYCLICLMFPIFVRNEIGGDLLIQYHCMKNDMVNILPTISLVQNHGCDGSGLNANINKKVGFQKICSEYKIFRFIDDINIQPNIERRYIDAVDFPFKNVIERFLLRIPLKIVIMLRIILNTMQFIKWPSFMRRLLIFIGKKTISKQLYKRLLDYNK